MNPQETDQANPQIQVIERLKTAVNILVTVSNNPSVDQLAAAVGFTLMLNKMGKHATAVFSGNTPSTIEFLKPEATIEKNTDSLRDFIVSLDKSKADKLRYKVEDNVVKIFITPYRTSLTEKDLDFSQGDFNVDAVIALGVAEREQLDQAIVAHGRILHDATVITISAGEVVSSLGIINWQDPSSSSLCEMLVGVGEALQPGLLDGQIATAYLTGIVAQTERFRNSKTTPKIMTMSAQLMAAGANQQLIADSLEVAPEIAAPTTPEVSEKESAPAQSPDGSLTIDHDNDEKTPEASKESGLNLDMPDDTQPKEAEHTSQIAIDEHGNLQVTEPNEVSSAQPASRRRIIEPLTSLDSSDKDAASDSSHPFTANMSEDKENEPSSDPLSNLNTSNTEPLLDHDSPNATLPEPTTSEPAEPDMTLPPISTLQPDTSVVDTFLPPITDTPSVDVVPVAEAQTLPPALDNNTLRDIEKTFDSNHIVQDPTSTLDEIETAEHSPHAAEQAETVDSARDAVSSAINAAPYDPVRPQPLQALNATHIDLPESEGPSLVASGAPVVSVTDATNQAADPSVGMSTRVLPPAPDQPFVMPSTSPTVGVVSNDFSGQSPPPVPPPLLPVQ